MLSIHSKVHLVAIQRCNEILVHHGSISQTKVEMQYCRTIHCPYILAETNIYLHALFNVLLVLFFLFLIVIFGGASLRAQLLTLLINENRTSVLPTHLKHNLRWVNHLGYI